MSTEPSSAASNILENAARNDRPERTKLHHCPECHHAFGSDKQMVKHRKMHECLKKLSAVRVKSTILPMKRPPPGLIPVNGSKMGEFPNDQQTERHAYDTANSTEIPSNERKSKPQPPIVVDERSPSNSKPILHFKPIAPKPPSHAPNLIVARKSKPPLGSPAKSSTPVPQVKQPPAGIVSENANGTSNVAVTAQALPVSVPYLVAPTSIVHSTVNMQKFPIRTPGAVSVGLPQSTADHCLAVTPSNQQPSSSASLGSNRSVARSNHQENLSYILTPERISPMHSRGQQTSPVPSASNFENGSELPCSAQAFDATNSDPMVRAYECVWKGCHFVEMSLKNFEAHELGHKEYVCSACRWTSTLRWLVVTHIRNEKVSHAHTRAKVLTRVRTGLGKEIELRLSVYIEKKTTEASRKAENESSDSSRPAVQHTDVKPLVQIRLVERSVVTPVDTVASSSSARVNGLMPKHQESGAYFEKSLTEVGQEAVPEDVLTIVPPDVSIIKRSGNAPSVRGPSTSCATAPVETAVVISPRVKKEPSSDLVSKTISVQSEPMIPAADPISFDRVGPAGDCHEDVKENIEMKPIVYEEQYFPPPDIEEVKPILMYRRAGQQREWICEDCDFTSTRRQAVVLHTWKHHRTTHAGFQCAICDFRSSFVNDVFEHFQEKHKEHALQSFYRKVDQEVTKASPRLEESEDIGIPCDKDHMYDFYEKYGIFADDGDRDNCVDGDETDDSDEECMELCTQCNYLAPSPEELALHRVNHERLSGKFMCPECFYWVDAFEDLAAHVSVHGLSPSDMNPERTASAARNDASTEETAVVNSPSRVQSPKPKSVHVKNPANLTAVQKQAVKWEKKNKFLCDRCPFRTSSKAKLKVHRVMHDRTILPKGYIRRPRCDCPIHGSSLKRHLNVHDRNESFQAVMKELEEEEAGLKRRNGDEEIAPSAVIGKNEQNDVVSGTAAVQEDRSQVEVSPEALESFHLEEEMGNEQQVAGHESHDEEAVMDTEEVGGEGSIDLAFLDEEDDEYVAEGHSPAEEICQEEEQGVDAELMELMDEDDFEAEALASYYTGVQGEESDKDPEEDNVVEPCDLERSTSETNFVMKTIDDSDMGDEEAGGTVDLIEYRSQLKTIPYVSVRVNNEPEDRETYLCRFCNYMDKHKPTVEDHEWQHGEEAQELIDDGFPKCDSCSFVCPDGTRLSQHKMVHRTKVKIKSWLPEPQSRTEPRKRKLRGRPRKQVTRRSTRTSHRKLYLPKTGRVCFCRHCPYADISVNVAERHLKCHDKQFSIKCTQCSYSASVAATMRKHVDVHDENVQREKLKKCLTRCNGKRHIDYPIQEVHNRLLGDFLNEFPSAEDDLEFQRDYLLKVANGGCGKAREEDLDEDESLLNEPPGSPAPVSPTIRKAATKSRDQFRNFHASCMRTRGPVVPNDLPEIEREFLVNTAYARPHPSTNRESQEPTFDRKLSVSRVKAMNVQKRKRKTKSVDEEDLLLGGAKKVKCTACPYIAESTGDLEAHATGHDPKHSGTVQCKYCSYSTSEGSLIAEHEKMHFLPPAEPNVCADLSGLERQVIFIGSKTKRRRNFAVQREEKRPKLEGNAWTSDDEIMDLHHTEDENAVAAEGGNNCSAVEEDESIPARADDAEGKGLGDTVNPDHTVAIYDEEDEALFRFAEVDDSDDAKEHEEREADEEDALEAEMIAIFGEDGSDEVVESEAEVKDASREEEEQQIAVDEDENSSEGVETVNEQKREDIGMIGVDERMESPDEEEDIAVDVQLVRAVQNSNEKGETIRVGGDEQKRENIRKMGVDEHSRDEVETIAVDVQLVVEDAAQIRVFGNDKNSREVVKMGVHENEKSSVVAKNKGRLQDKSKFYCHEGEDKALDWSFSDEEAMDDQETLRCLVAEVLHENVEDPDEVNKEPKEVELLSDGAENKEVESGENGLETDGNCKSSEVEKTGVDRHASEHSEMKVEESGKAEMREAEDEVKGVSGPQQAEKMGSGEGEVMGVDEDEVTGVPKDEKMGVDVDKKVAIVEAEKMGVANDEDNCEEQESKREEENNTCMGKSVDGPNTDHESRGMEKTTVKEEDRRNCLFNKNLLEVPGEAVDDETGMQGIDECEVEWNDPLAVEMKLESRNICDEVDEEMKRLRLEDEGEEKIASGDPMLSPMGSSLQGAAKDAVASVAEEASSSVAPSPDDGNVEVESSPDDDVPLMIVEENEASVGTKEACRTEMCPEVSSSTGEEPN